MKQLVILLMLLFVPNITKAISLNDNIRIAVICQYFPTITNDPDQRINVFSFANACVSIVVPTTATIYAGPHPVGTSNGVICHPLFLTDKGETLIDFTIYHSCNDNKHSHKLRVTNSRGYDRYFTMCNQLHFRDVIPLSPTGSTDIAIILTY